MTLLTTVIAAITSTAIWYIKDSKNQMKTGTLSLIYWGASIMWLTDAFFEYIKTKNMFFSPAPAEMLNDLFLGISAVTLGMIIWLILLLIKDPKKVLK